MRYCELCNRKFAEEKHHLVFGRGIRNIADADDLIMWSCGSCHNKAIKPEDRIHGNPRAEDLSKKLGEALWIIKNNLSDDAYDKAKESFLKRYGRNYL